MRRPRFRNWVRLQVLACANAKSFSLRKFVALAQARQDDGGMLAAALLLYAHENGCLDRLMSLVYDDSLRREYESVEAHLGARSVERLALRGTPLMSLPESYRTLLGAYEQAYHSPEFLRAEKNALRDRARAGMLRSGLSPATLARQLGVDPGNLNAFLARGETHRLTLETARRLAELAA